MFFRLVRLFHFYVCLFGEENLLTVVCQAGFHNFYDGLFKIRSQLRSVFITRYVW